METVDLEVLLRRRATRQQRLLRVLLTLSVPLLVLVFVVHPIVSRPAGPAKSGIPAVQVNPSISTNISFGAVQVNGTPVHGTWPITTRLRPGRNVIRLDAPPFLPVSCSLPWPLDPHLLSGPTGSYTRHGPLPAPPRALGPDACDFTWGTIDGAISSLDIDLPVTSANLPPTLRSEAIATVAQALARVALPTVPVPADAYYAAGLDAQGQTTGEIAGAPLVEWPTLAPDAADDTMFNRCGNLGCASAFEVGGSTADRIKTWSIDEAVQVTLHFATPAGQMVSTVRMPLGVEVPLTLALGADSIWQVIGPLAEGATPQEASAIWSQLDLCSEGLQLLYRPLKPIGMWALPQETVGSDGCRLQAGTYKPGAAGTSEWVPAGEFLWRFGVLLAQDAPAHQLIPGLPMAPPDEASVQS